jgi:hypothetical protein
MSTPTMSPEVLQSASDCHGMRIGRAVQPSRLISATYSPGHWIVELEGLWEFEMPLRATAVSPPGAPTSTPPAPWERQYFVTDCRMTLDAATGYVSELSAWEVTATPPSP